MSNELFNKFLNLMTDDELKGMISNQKIIISGFRNDAKNIPNVLLKNIIKDYLKKHKSSKTLESKEDYLELKDKNINEFNLLVLNDLYRDINIEIINEFLTNKEKSNKAINNLSSMSFRKENNELKVQKEKLDKRILELTREIEKNKKIYDKENDILKHENQKLVKEIENLKEIISKYKENIEKNNVALNEISGINKFQKEKLEYYDSIFKTYNIILFKLEIKDKLNFPYNFEIINNYAELEIALNNNNFTDFWYLKNSLDPFLWNKILMLLKKSSDVINIRAIDENVLELLKIGVKL